MKLAVSLCAAVAGTLAFVAQDAAEARSLKAGKPLPGIVLVTNGPSILLSWDPKSPLARYLIPRSRVEVVASYESAAGPVTGEPVAEAFVAIGTTALQFDLARQLRNAPSGPVCLRLKFGHNQSVPLRVPRAGESSDGFRNARWEKSVAVASRVSNLEREKSRVTAAIATLEGMAQPFERWRSEQGLADSQACEAIQPRPESRQPRAAISGSAQEPAAQYQCVGQFAGFVQFDIARPGVDANAFAAEMLVVLRRARETAATDARYLRTLDERIAQAGRLIGALAANPDAAGSGFRPYLHHNGLSLTSESQALLSRLGRKPDAVAAAAILDAFGSCLTEARSQFELAYQNWQASLNPVLLEKRAELDRKDCRARFVSEGERQRELLAKRSRLAEVETLLGEAEAIPELSPQTQSSLVLAACELSPGSKP